MRIPEASVIFRSFFETDSLTRSEDAVEDLAWWSSSDGKRLPARLVRVHAGRIHDKVFAVIQPIRRTASSEPL
jgi:hypothetical protein